ncbi:hypothetical protein OXPF_06560 [Oxobacter pfennigii]|uniref:Uncharacterized protein n=1 Tax=Oxobacter pfennigii TaxID=36849 RepID=A0A0P8W9X9_9CLOT|nr:hypothetical protein [Oxobacter pfennigii]KPU45423.1 hypothetical protein OXPF_06560 [Oxobacter pfennigii]
MKKIAVFIKDFTKFHKIIIVSITCFSLFTFYNYMQSKARGEQTSDAMNNAIINDMKLMNTMFPDQKFINQGKYYNTGERKSYFIEGIIPGSFVNEGNDELLVIARRPSDELSHAEGFYNAYMAVFDNSSSKLVSEVKLFSVDEGSYRIFDSQGISYIFFAGSTTYQGWENWYGGLWQAGPEWTMKWPKDIENQEYYDFWENRAVKIGTDDIEILERKVLPIKNNGQIIPDYTWEYSEKLLWDKQGRSFKEME